MTEADGSKPPIESPPATVGLSDYIQVLGGLIPAVALFLSATSLNELISFGGLVIAAAMLCNMILYFYRHYKRLTIGRVAVWATVWTVLTALSLIAAVALRPGGSDGKPVGLQSASPTPVVSQPELIGQPVKQQDGIRIPKAHGGLPATSVAFSLDGKILATGGHDKDVRLWDATTGAFIAKLEGHEHFVTSLAVNPVTGVLASGGYDRTVRLWDMSKRTSIATIETRHGNIIKSLAFSPDGKLLASASPDWSVKLFDTATLVLKNSFVASGESVEFATFSPDGKTVAMASDNAVRLWDVASGRQRAYLQGHRDWVRGVAFSLDSAIVVTSSVDATIRVWNAANGSLSSTIAASAGMQCLAPSPDGKSIAFGEGQQVILRNFATGDQIKALPFFNNEILGLAFSADGKKVAAASFDGDVGLWTVA